MVGHSPGVRQVLCRRDQNEGEDLLDLPEQGFDLPSIPGEARYVLMRFLMAPNWSLACDILAEHPSLLTPWASSFLRTMVLEEHLTTADVDVLCAHIFVLKLAHTLGIEGARALLHHFD